MKQKILLIIFLFSHFWGWRLGTTHAQDIHFSQFDAAPLTLNPALTGVMDMNYRLANNYKNQWGTVAPPYSTMAFSYDMNLMKNSGKSTLLGLGFSLFRDKAGKSQLTTTQFNFSVSAIQKLDEKNTFSAGLQGGYAQKSINLSQLSWDNQYDGNKHDPALPSKEIGYANKKGYMDISAGGYWTSQATSDLKFATGVAYFHANRPDKSFGGIKDKLPSKIVVHHRTEIKLRHYDNMPDRYLVPKILYMRQGAQQELFLGAFVKTVIKPASRYTNWQNEVTFDLGAFFRAGDAIIAATSFDYGRLRIGLSYDVNISGLKTASSYNGGIECSLIYTGMFNMDKRIKVKGVPRI